MFVHSEEVSVQASVSSIKGHTVYQHPQFQDSQKKRFRQLSDLVLIKQHIINVTNKDVCR